MEQLAIRLGASAQDSIQWLLWSPAEQEIIASGTLEGSEQLDTLQTKSNGAQVIAIAPSSSLGFKTVTMPKKSNRKVLQAIPYMLEEDIADDVSQLFFAFGERQGEQQQVVFCKHSMIQTWQTMLSDAGLFCDVLVPDILCLPNNEDSAAMLQIEDKVIVRWHDLSGATGEPSWLLPVLLDNLSRTNQSLVCYSECDFELPQNDVNIQSDYTYLPMQLLLQGAVSAKINLLQGEYKVKRKSTGQWHKWKIAAGLAALALIINLVDKSIEIQQIQTQRTEVRAQIAQVTKQGFPDLGKVLNHRRILSREVAKLEQGGGGVSMLVMLSQLAPVFSQTGVTPQSLRFDGNRTELRMQSVANSFDALERFKRDAELLGFAVEQGAINNKGDQVTGSIVIKG